MTTKTQPILFEIGTEELPPTALLKLSLALADGFEQGLKEAHLNYKAIQHFATPRRLAVLVEACQTEQPNKEIERRGPAIQAAFDAEGQPTKAALGFARSCGVDIQDLDRQKTDKGEWLLFKQIQIGKKTSDLLPSIAEKALNQLPIPKKMRWGDNDFQFIRPVHWIVFIQGEEVIPCSLFGIDAGRYSYGHRFHHPKQIWLTQPNDYETLLKETGMVIVSFEKRRQKIRQQIIFAAEALACFADIDDDLLDEVTALVEFPVPIAGDFDEKYLEIPHEALIYTMKTNQKYFHLYDEQNNLKNYFLTIANIKAPDSDIIRQGNERVIRPRLEDAMFFWQQDAKNTLESHLEHLKTVVFQNQLGTMYDKTERVRKLSIYIAELIGANLAITERVARLSRCDLMTEMVGEFAAMQGIMGAYQARRDHEDEAIITALPEFYLPKFAGDKLPETLEGTAVSLAEKIDTLVGIFGINLKPTGDKDPFALRRAAIGALRILNEKSLPINIQFLLDITKHGYDLSLPNTTVLDDVYTFLMNRLKVIYTNEGINPKLIDSVAAVKSDSIADFNLRLDAVKHFVSLPEAETLIASNKRIQNILSKAEGDIAPDIDESLFNERIETVLLHQINILGTTIKPLLRDKDYIKTLNVLVSVHDTIDEFFNNVMVMDKIPAIKANRLALLNRLRTLFIEVADISKLQGLQSA